MGDHGSKRSVVTRPARRRDVKMLTAKERKRREQVRQKAAYIRRRAALLEQRAKLPPDPISLLSILDRAYIAGLVDGDGCIRITRTGRSKLYKYPEVVVAMTHRGVIRWLKSVLSSGNIQVFNYTQCKKNPQWRKQYGVVLTGKRAKLLCEQLLPFLRVKKRQAVLICQFPCEDRRGRGAKVGTDVLRKRMQLYRKMRQLNLRGPILVRSKKCRKTRKSSGVTAA